MDCELRIDLASRLASTSPIVVEIGCGDSKTPGAIGIDRMGLPNVDIVANIEDGLEFLPDSTVDVLVAKSVLEHVENLDFLLREIARVLRPSGRFEVFVPHFSNPYFYSDPTHVRCFGLYTFRYLARGMPGFRRPLPDFYTTRLFSIISEELVFTSPFRGRRQVKRVLGAIVNWNVGLMEAYEENLCWVFPCYGIRVVLKPLPKSLSAQTLPQDSA